MMHWIDHCMGSAQAIGILKRIADVSVEDGAAVSATLCSAVVDSVLQPAAQGLLHLEESERGAVLSAVTASLPTAFALFERCLSLAHEVRPHPPQGM